MSLPYPTDDRQNLQIPDPNNLLPQFQSHQPPAGTPFTHLGGGYPQPGYPPQPHQAQPGYPYQAQQGQPGYPPQPQFGYAPTPQPMYPQPQLPDESYPAPGQALPPPQPFHEQPGHPEPLAAPGLRGFRNPGGVSTPGKAVREFMSDVKQNEGLLPKSGQLLGLGKSVRTNPLKDNTRHQSLYVLH